MTKWPFSPLFLAVCFVGCDAGKPSGDATATAAPATATPTRVASADPGDIVARIAPSEPVDVRFEGCAEACGARAPESLTLTTQPGAAVGDHAHCPVSGAVFEVKASSPRRIVDGKTLFFCCEACANYFSANSERVLAARGLGPAPGS